MALHIGGPGSCGPSCPARRSRRTGRGRWPRRLSWSGRAAAPRGVGDGGDILPRVQRPAGLLRVAHRQVGGTVSSQRSTAIAAGLGSATLDQGQVTREDRRSAAAAK